MSRIHDIVEWAKEHKVAAGASVLVALLVFTTFIAGAAVLLSGPTHMGGQSAEMGRTTAADSGSLLFDLGADSSKSGIHPPSPDGGAGSYVEVQEAQIDIESKDADADESAIRLLAESQNGYVERSRTHESDLYRTIYLTVRVPDQNFDAFVNSVKDSYKVESANVQHYRLSTQREMDELEIIRETMDEYETIRDRIVAMNESTEKLELLATLTEKELELQEKKKRYERSLADKEKLSNESRVSITLREEKDVELWPENLKNRFMNEVKYMINSVVNTLISIVTDSIVLFFQAIKWLIALAVVAVPVLFAYRIARRFYEQRKNE